MFVLQYTYRYFRFLNVVPENERYVNIIAGNSSYPLDHIRQMYTFQIWMSDSQVFHWKPGKSENTGKSIHSKNGT